LWRTKEAFSDGVSKTTRSLYEIIQENVTSNFFTFNEKYEHNAPDTEEKKYYREIFESSYRGLGNVVPYFWMPRYVEAKDASARTLQIYNEVKSDTS
jgi:asparagine synthase (glutamine-hydrolysing)